MANIKLYKELYRKFGAKQIYVAIEELSELQKELCKMLRNENTSNLEQIKDEIADVQIMMEQIICFLNINKTELESIKKKKLLRTRERLKL